MIQSRLLRKNQHAGIVDPSLSMAISYRWKMGNELSSSVLTNPWAERTFIMWFVDENPHSRKCSHISYHACRECAVDSPEWITLRQQRCVRPQLRPNRKC